MIIVKSKIEKGTIRIPRKLGLPDGTPVVVRIEPMRKTGTKQKIISELSGSWSNDPSLIPIFKEIEKERHSYLGREVIF
jgi:hypothetical protein